MFSEICASLINDPSIIELYGSPGTGKTYFLLMLSSYILLPISWNGVQINGLDKFVLYIDTSYSFSLIQLINILENLIIQNLNDINSWTESDMESCIQNCLSKFHLIQVDNCKSLSEIFTQLDDYFTNFNIKAFICDISISFTWLEKFEGHQDYMKNISNMLNKFSAEYLLNIFITRTDISSIESNAKLATAESISKAKKQLTFSKIKKPDEPSSYLLVYSGKTEYKFKIDDNGIHFEK